MFSKKCSKCRRKVEKDFLICPYCGNNLKKEKEARDFGLLGKDDFDFENLSMGMPFGLDRVFSGLVKQLDSQLKQIDKEIGKEEINLKEQRKKFPPNARGISISISTGTGIKPEIKVSGFGEGFENSRQEKEVKIKKQEISEEKARKIAKLPREEAETKVRRIGNKLIYEISMPRVEKLEDVFISKLENSIEIKAFSKDKVYFKLLPIKLPLLRYGLKDETLFLEFESRT